LDLDLDLDLDLLNCVIFMFLTMRMIKGSIFWGTHGSPGPLLSGEPRFPRTPPLKETKVSFGTFLLDYFLIAINCHILKTTGGVLGNLGSPEKLIRKKPFRHLKIK